MRTEQLTINSQCTFHWNLEEALDAYAAAGFRNVEPHLNLVHEWLDDGHTVEQTRELFESRELRAVASSQLEVMCFGSPDARISNLKANAANAEVIRELGADKMIVGTDGPEQVSVEELDAVARAMWNLAEFTEGLGVDIAIEFRIAVLGAGRLGSFRARILSELPAVEEVIIGNRTVERAEEVAREVGGSAGTIDEAIDSEPDAVFVSLATELHAEALHRCIDAELPIFCEKPIALTLPETASVIEHANEAGNLIQVAFQRRLDPDYRQAYQAVRDGSLGTLYSVRITAHDAEPAPEEFIASSGGTYRDLHIHDFDLARWLTGLNVEQVYAVGNVREFDRYAKYDDVDNAAILMTMSDGLPVIITGTRHNPRGHDFRMEVFGSEDSISVGQDSLSQPRPVEPDAPSPDKGPYGDFMERFGECLRQETMAFIEVMKGERENPSPPAAAMEALRVAVACEVSRKEGRPVRVAEIEDELSDSS